MEEHEVTEAAVREQPWMEKHLQTLIMAALGGICTWMAVTTQSLTVSVATMNEKITFLQTQMEATGTDRYHSEDARRDLALRDSQIADLRARVVDLEQYHKLNRK